MRIGQRILGSALAWLLLTLSGVVWAQDPVPLIDTVAGTAEYYPDMLIFRNDGDLTEDDYVVRANSEYFSIPSYGSAGAVSLSVGAYLVAIGTESLNASEAVSACLVRRATIR